MQRFQIVLLAMLWTNQSAQAQSVIINEMSQGSDGGKEWVELLVVDDNLDLRGWELGDNDDGIWDAIAEFSSHSDWQSVARGTIIVIYNSGDVDGTITAAGGEDTTFGDKSVILGIDNSTYLIDTGAWGSTAGAFANSDGDDCPAIRDAADVIVHDMAVTHPVATISAPGTAKVKYFSDNTVEGVVDDSQWTEVSSSSATPGETNGGDNSNWVDQSLPVELSSWFASSTKGQVKLSWTTDSEIENQGFIIERTLRTSSFDGAQDDVSQWKEITSFTSNPDLLGQGSTSSRTNYTYIDKQVKVGETYSYRLSDVDYRGGVTRHSEIGVTVREADHDLKPSDVTLHAAFPNPFNPEVNLSFTLEQEVEDLSLEIYDLQGILIHTLSSGYHKTGTHEYMWNGNDGHGNAVSSGIYMVRLSTGSVVQIQRVTLLR
ncbi:MAG: T9SS type A sorting domain-containing protein [Candidatus Marinimicrobia bacterium]|nr:T9SS type A sorting domain-containing protein [Candidatus Neomarinimicrobiota bacterium]